MEERDDLDTRDWRDGPDDLDGLVGTWLTLPEVAERLDTSISRVRRMLDDRLLLAVRRGRPAVLRVPAAMVEPEPMGEMPGTVTVLADSGFSTEETLRWLFTEDPSLPGTPVAALRQGRKTEVRRRAQALAF